MGYYINPSDGTGKEDWLRQHGRPLAAAPARHDDGDGLAVCLIDNGLFTAAAICYCQAELTAFADPSDRRPKTWFMVPKPLLQPFL